MDNDGSNVLRNYENSVLDGAANGDLKKVSNCYRLLPSLSPDVRDTHGWTALMLAARNGHTSIVEFLLQNG